MNGPESAYRPSECDVVMTRLHYLPEEAARLKQPPRWYRLYDNGELENSEPGQWDEALRQALVQQRDDIASGAPRITAPYEFSDGRFSHSASIPRSTFAIPGHLSLDREMAQPEASHQARRTATANRFVELLKRRRDEGYDD